MTLAGRAAGRATSAREERLQVGGQAVRVSVQRTPRHPDHAPARDGQATVALPVALKAAVVACTWRPSSSTTRRASGQATSHVLARGELGDGGVRRRPRPNVTLGPPEGPSTTLGRPGWIGGSFGGAGHRVIVGAEA